MAKSVGRRNGGSRKARGVGGERLVARAPVAEVSGSGFHEPAKYGKRDRRAGRRALREE